MAQGVVTDQIAVRRLPGRPRSARVEKAIINAAIDLLTKHGINGTSMESVATQAGVAKTTIYRRWPNKADLVMDVLAQLKGPLPQPPGTSVRDDLIFLISFAWRHAQNTPAGRLFTRLAAEVRDSPELIEQYHERIVRPRRQMTRSVLERGVAEGTIRPGLDYDFVVGVLSAPVMVHTCISPRRFSQEYVENLVDLILTGISPRM